MTRRPDYADGYYSPPSQGWRPRWWNRLACWCDNRLQIHRIWQEINEMRRDMEAAEQEQYDRGAQLVGLIKAEFASLHTQLDGALADSDAKVAAAAKADSLADAERIKGLLDELASVLPGQVPDVPVPDPGQPAELPADNGDSSGSESAGGDSAEGDSGSAPDEPVTSES